MPTVSRQEEAEKDLNSGLPGLRLSSKRVTAPVLNPSRPHLPCLKRQGHTNVPSEQVESLRPREELSCPSPFSWEEKTSSFLHIQEDMSSETPSL